MRKADNKRLWHSSFPITIIHPFNQPPLQSNTATRYHCIMHLRVVHVRQYLRGSTPISALLLLPSTRTNICPQPPTLSCNSMQQSTGEGGVTPAYLPAGKQCVLPYARNFTRSGYSLEVGGI